jgi:hypothetical protein
MPAWQILLRYDYIKSDTTSFTNNLVALGSPGSVAFETITAAGTGASGRTAVGDGQGLYDAFFEMTNVTKIGFMDGSISSLIPTSHDNYLVYDLVESTDISSVYGILMDHNNTLKNGPQIQNNDTVYGTASVLQLTASLSGILTASGGTEFHTNDSGRGYPYPEHFCMTGINRQSDNDTQALCAYTGPLLVDAANTKGDSWRVNNPAQTFWSYWGDDFHTNTTLRRIGNQRQTNTGVADTAGMYNGPLYLMGYGDYLFTFEPSSTSPRLTLNEAMTPVTMTQLSASAEVWSIAPSLPTGLNFDVCTGDISGTPTVYDVVGTTYTVSGADIDGNEGISTLIIKILDTDSSVGIDYGFPDTSVALMLNTTLPSSLTSSISLIDIAPINNYRQRRSMLRNIFNGLNNNTVNSFRTTRADLDLTSEFTKDDIIVYRPNQIIDLATLDPSQGAYSPIYEQGEGVTFLNVGGSQSVEVRALGDGSYNVLLNNVQTELTYGEGEEYIIAGVSFIFGSVGTEGSNDGGICLTGDAQVLTTEGYLSMKKITSTHSLPGPTPIEQLVRTTHGAEMYLVSKDVYGHGQPFQDTVFTGEHRVLCPLTKRYHCASDLPLVKVIKYLQPIYVYNIIVHGQTHLMVNGLTVESLSHNNINVQTRRNIVHIPKKAS